MDEIVTHIQQLIADDERLHAFCEAQANAAGVTLDSDDGLAMQAATIKQALTLALEAF